MASNVTGAHRDHDIPPNAQHFEEFYLNLVKNRSDLIRGVGLRESYTHMREHSNSIFIVLLELSLASLVVFTLRFAPEDMVTRVEVVALLFFIWILPGVYIWSQANRLEAILTRSKGN